MVEVKGASFQVSTGWAAISERLNDSIKALPGLKKVVLVETYQGVIHEELIANLSTGLKYDRFINASDYMYSEEEIKKLVFPDVTDDRIFGFLTRLSIEDYLDSDKVKEIKAALETITEGVILIYGSGASLLYSKPDLLVYADMARWEIQLRMRKHLVDNLGLKNKHTTDWMLLYKQGYFVDWRVCDKLKKTLFERIDFLLDTTKIGEPKLVEGAAIRAGMKQAINRPFSVVPFFDPGPWGGQWMKEVCNLDPSAPNYAWCFNCVPEENSLLLKFGDDIIEIPSINLVFMHPKELLGELVYERFGDEFPIRFDFLDTMKGGTGHTGVVARVLSHPEHL